MNKRIRSGHFVLVATAKGRTVGMIEMRHHRHISLLFVEPGCQGRGLGRGLLERAVEEARKANPGLREMTVNSSPNAIAAYERMGFESTGPQQDINGVRSIPMKNTLGEKEKKR